MLKQSIIKVKEELALERAKANFEYDKEKVMVLIDLLKSLEMLEGSI